MLKRICVLVCVILICLNFALPCFATGGVGSSNLRYSSIPIDVIRLNNGAFAGAFAEWPYDVASDVGSHITTDFYSAHVYSSWNSGSTPLIYGDFQIGDATSFTLISHLTYLDSQTSFKLSYYDSPTDITFSRIVIEYDVVGVEDFESSGFYHGTMKHIYFDSSSYGGLNGAHELDVVFFIKYAYEAQTGKDFVIGTHKILQNLNIRIDFSYDTDPSAFHDIAVEINADNNPGQVIVDWLDFLNIRTDTPIGEFDPLGWLVDIMESFLQFELFPGFSLDTLLHLVIILEVVFVLLKIIS